MPGSLLKCLSAVQTGILFMNSKLAGVCLYLRLCAFAVRFDGVDRETEPLCYLAIADTISPERRDAVFLMLVHIPSPIQKAYKWMPSDDKRKNGGIRPP